MWQFIDDRNYWWNYLVDLGNWEACGPPNLLAIPWGCALRTPCNSGGMRTPDVCETKGLRPLDPLRNRARSSASRTPWWFVPSMNCLTIHGHGNPFRCNELPRQFICAAIHHQRHRSKLSAISTKLLVSCNKGVHCEPLQWAPLDCAEQLPCTSAFADNTVWIN